MKFSKQGDSEEVAQLLRWRMLAGEDLVHMHSHSVIDRRHFTLCIYGKRWIH